MLFGGYVGVDGSISGEFMYVVESSAGFEIGHGVGVVWKYIHTMDGDAVRLAVSTPAVWRHPSIIHSNLALLAQLGIYC
jgi:hypothetical protein